nr:phage/plasmid primase, P4 family [Actinomycetota bacterium]
MHRDRSNTNGHSPSIHLAGKHCETVLEAAVDYTRRGVRVTPLNGKEPILRSWQNRLLDEEDLSGLFLEGRNVGALLGEPSGGLTDVDLELPQAVEAADHLLPETLTYGRNKAPRSHRLFVCTPALRSSRYSLTKPMASDLGMGSSRDRTMLVELRSTGLQSVLPPSVHPLDKDLYRWEGGVLLEVAGEEFEILVREVATATLLSLYCPRGARQQFFLAAAGFLGRRLNAERVVAILEATAAAAGDEEHEKRAGAVRDTLEKLEADENVTGAPTLDELAPGTPDLICQWWEWRKNGGGGSGGSKKVPTHDELRDRWLQKRQHTAFGLGEWRRYEEGVWRPVGDLAVEREISEILEGAKAEGVRPSAPLVASVERLARAKASVDDAEWDAQKDILVCSNGTLEISSRTIRKHRPEDHALAAVPYGYDPAAAAPTWRRYLETTVPGAASFLQEFAGYALTVDTAHEIALWLHGPPGTGKSTFVEGLKTMLGPRAGLLGLADVQRSRFALANIPGKTLVVATEQPSDFVNSTHVINALISGEELSVEKKFKDSYSVVPRAKICWAMNELPRVGDANNGLFRRVKVVAFPRLETSPDPTIKRKIRHEGAGILRWALEGLGQLRERGGFEIPDSVLEATNEFRKTNDVPGLFVRDACSVSPAAKVRAAKL